MKIDFDSVRECLKSFDFKTLFREHLGWDNYQAKLDIPVEGGMVRLTALAEKRGFVAFLCPSIPDCKIRIKIDHQVTKSAREHLVIYADQSAGLQVWQWIRREPCKPLASCEHRFDSSQSGEPIIQRLEQVAVALDEEESITLIDIAGRARAAFDVDKVTKKFYDRFKTEHAAFLKFIKGIKADTDLQWYTSLMLNRLMFVYFIQKKGFLDGDTDYLRNRLALVQQAKGMDKFQSFYRYFLLRLFHDGLGKPPSERKLDAAMEKLLGKVPYLNGGFFEVHQLEEHNPDIDIPDKAFEKLFDFFDKYSWHLDERPLRADNEINPDVVGYIFEKYINQKQMGAYYTKEDITEYISKNTIIPFLFDSAEKKCAIAFKPDSALWQLLSDNPDRYIYSAVRHGVVDDKGNIIPLPKEIEAGVKDVAKRDGWNKTAADPFGLSTETWREHVARRQRCLEIREKLSKGEVHQINDLITLNLDILHFARDAIVNSKGPELLRAFWHAIKGVTVLDPTCGSGAFLFAALRILETLYSDCLERMKRFIEDLAGKKHHPKQYSDFKKVLAQIARHPNERYFILKSIIINNLFGVDIMDEAVEICKLRLFLKLVAQVEKVEQIEPLPDIDFNIRSGNTLVGYTSLDQVRKSQEGILGFGDEQIRRIEEDAEMVERAFQQFRDQQTTHGGKVTHKDKQELRARLNKLDTELDRYLAGEYGISSSKYGSRATYDQAFDEWKSSHEPFHWFAEFFGIMKAGGFDVIIGNPPYVSTSKVDYLSTAAKAQKFPDLYAHVLLRTIDISSACGRFGMIVPLSITFSQKFTSLREALTSVGKAWFSSYDNIPAALFAGVSQRCTIWIGDRSAPMLSVSPMYRWRSITRDFLIENVCYTQLPFCEINANGLPKLSSSTSASLLSSIVSPPKSALRTLIIPSSQAKNWLRFSQTARNFVSAFKDDAPCLEEATLKSVPSSQNGKVAIAQPEQVFAALSTVVGELYFWYWLTRGDGFHVTSWIVADFIQVLAHLPEREFNILTEIGKILHQRRFEALTFKKNAGKHVGNFSYRGHPWLTRRADMVLLAGLGMSREAVLKVFDHVQRVLAINEFAGEKSIPAAVKAKYRPQKPDEAAENAIFSQADALILKHFGFTQAELRYLLHSDIIYKRGGRDPE
ncbi:MAG: DNA methyltransferase [Planctomycetota bacterium]|nr:DNA methyltransferase [Planctomycetota bacterium]